MEMPRPRRARAQHGSLYDLLHNETLPMGLGLCLGILVDVARGMEYLHSGWHACGGASLGAQARERVACAPSNVPRSIPLFLSIQARASLCLTVVTGIS